MLWRGDGCRDEPERSKLEVAAGTSCRAVQASQWCACSHGQRVGPPLCFWVLAWTARTACRASRGATLVLPLCFSTRLPHGASAAPPCCSAQGSTLLAPSVPWCRHTSARIVPWRRHTSARIVPWRRHTSARIVPWRRFVTLTHVGARALRPCHVSFMLHRISGSSVLLQAGQPAASGKACCFSKAACCFRQGLLLQQGSLLIQARLAASARQPAASGKACCFSKAAC